MFSIPWFKLGLVSLLFFVLASNVFNLVSINSTVWTVDSPFATLWSSCQYGLNNNQNLARTPCFLSVPPALIGTGTAFNVISLLLALGAQFGLFKPVFAYTPPKAVRLRFPVYLVLGAVVASLLSVLFNSTGWYFIISPQYQSLIFQNNVRATFMFGWSFWLMTPVFSTSIIAALIGTAMLSSAWMSRKLIAIQYQDQQY